MTVPERRTTEGLGGTDRVADQRAPMLIELDTLRKAAMLTAVVGVLHSVLFLTAFWLFSRAPGARSSDEEFVQYYESGDDRRTILVAGLYLMPFAGIAFIWFIVAMRAWARGYIRRENALLSNVQFVAGIIYMALFFAAAASSSVSAASAEFSDAVDPEIARLFPQYGSALLLVFAMRMAAMFVLTTTNILRPIRAMPRWFTVVGYLVALFLLLSASFNPWLVAVFPAWIVVLCLIIFRKARRIPVDGSLVAIEAEGIVLIQAAERAG